LCIINSIRILCLQRSHRINSMCLRRRGEKAVAAQTRVFVPRILGVFRPSVMSSFEYKVRELVLDAAPHAQRACLHPSSVSSSSLSFAPSSLSCHVNFLSQSSFPPSSLSPPSLPSSSVSLSSRLRLFRCPSHPPRPACGGTRTAHCARREDVASRRRRHARNRRLLRPRARACVCVEAVAEETEAA